MNPIDPESLIYRFAKQLEFGSATMQVASEAVRIVQRMNRDWMTTGRRPAGVCGAALILAARMNNFRRTVREVVYVVKVTEITISQRLNEFSSTESGELTIDQFRSVQLENAHDPPSFTRARRPGRVKRKPTTDDDADDLPTHDEPHERIDADGFAIPSLPVDPTLHHPPSAEVTPKTYQPSAEQLASEEALENEMSTLLATGSNMVQTAPAHTAQSTGTTATKPISSSTEIDAREFETDPEVAHCLLAPAEVEIKERIWVHENKDYLRTQQAKALKRALAEADSGPGVHKPRKRRRGRLGDVGYLEGGDKNGGDGEEEGDGRSTRASTPAEATRRMLERRGFSKKINYRLLETLYGDAGDAGGDPEPSDNKTGPQAGAGPDEPEEAEREADEEEADEPEGDDGDGVEAAFAGDYYDEYSDYSD